MSTMAVGVMKVEKIWCFVVSFKDGEGRSPFCTIRETGGVVGEIDKSCDFFDKHGAKAS